MKIIRLTDIARVPASHEDPEDPGVLKQVLLRREDLASGRIQMINWSTLLPGKSFRSHYHEAMDEVFIILNGEVEIDMGREMARLERGDTVVIAQREAHGMKNLTNTEVSYIAIGIARSASGTTVIV